MATLQNIGVLKYRDKSGNWKPLPVVLQSSGSGDSGGISTISGKGQPTESTVGQLNQLYRDELTDKLYICTGVEGGYTWAAVVSDTEDAVTYTAQTLTEEQKTQARANIGAGTSNFSGSYNDLNDKPDNPAAPVIDTTLTKSGQAADAKAAGDAIAQKLDATALPTAVNDALAQAKASGAFDGEKGDTGPEGPKGADGKDGAGMDVTGAKVGQIAKIKAVDSAGKPTGWEAVDMPSGGTYTLPIASPTVLGGVKPIAKTDAMTQGVGVDAAGALWTAALGGSDWDLIAHIDVTADVANDVTEWLYSDLPRYKYIAYRKINLKGSTETASGCSISINGEYPQPSVLSYAKSTGVANCHGLIYVMPFGWGHVATSDSNSPNNHAHGGIIAMYNTSELTDNAITSIKISSHSKYKIASGDIWLYGKK